jgi:hypothetical protein
MKRITERKKKQLEILYQKLKTAHDVDVSTPRRNNLLIEYRSLFNTICKRTYKVGPTDIARFYNSKGLKMTSPSVINSLSKFKIYANDMPELLDIFFDLSPSAKKYRDYQIDRKYIYNTSLTPIQELVSDLTFNQEQELIEMITLRKKSWAWKSKPAANNYEIINSH